MQLHTLIFQSWAFSYQFAGHTRSSLFALGSRPFKYMVKNQDGRLQKMWCGH